MSEATTTEKTKTVYVVTTTPTDSLDPGFTVKEVPLDEWAKDEIKEQPYY